MKKIMLLTKNEELIKKVKPLPHIVLLYRDFMKVFEQLNFHIPDYIILDFDCIEDENQFMLESLPKKSEENYMKLISIGSSFEKERLADFTLKYKSVSELEPEVF